MNRWIEGHFEVLLKLGFNCKHSCFFFSQEYMMMTMMMILAAAVDPCFVSQKYAQLQSQTERIDGLWLNGMEVCSQCVCACAYACVCVCV